MTQINKIEREKDIKQVSHTDVLQHSKEMSLHKPVHKLQDKTNEVTVSPKNLSYNVTIQTFQAAKRAGISAISHARMLSKNSNKTEDQDAIDKLEGSGRVVISDTIDAINHTETALKRQIKKKRSDIRNTKDIKSYSRTIRKADTSVKKSTEATQLVTKSSIEAAKQAVITSQKVAKAKKAERLARKSAESIKKIVKGIINALKRIGTTLGAASVPVMLILVLAASIAALVSSAFGIFFTGNASGEGTKTLREVVLDINHGYNSYIDEIKNSISHDNLIIEGHGTSWPDVVAVYAVYMTTKSEGAMDVVHMTYEHEQVLHDIFWTMNSVTYTTEETITIEMIPDLDDEGNQKTDSEGNALFIEQEKTTITLYIELDHVTALQEADVLYFNDEQKAELNELLDSKNASLWNTILGGIINTSNVGIASSNENCRIIYAYLTMDMGLSHASACGIIANIQYESSFDPHCLGDNGTSYGICQWHAERYTDLENWCNNHSYDYTTLEGQLHYLEHDLKVLHPGIFDHIESVENSSDGAYDAGYHWCVYFEIPSDRYNKAIERGTAAQQYYWNLS